MNRRDFLTVLGGALVGAMAAKVVPATRVDDFDTDPMRYKSTERWVMSWSNAKALHGLLEVTVSEGLDQDAWDVHVRADDGYTSAFMLAVRDVEDVSGEYKLAALLRRKHDERVPS